MLTASQTLRAGHRHGFGARGGTEEHTLGTTTAFGSDRAASLPNCPWVPKERLNSWDTSSSSMYCSAD